MFVIGAQMRGKHKILDTLIINWFKLKLNRGIIDGNLKIISFLLKSCN